MKVDVESTKSSRDNDQLTINSKIVIKSLYLQRQDTDPEAEKYREYLKNKETFNETRRRQLFKQKDVEGKQKLDYSRYKKRTCVVGIPSKTDPEKCGCRRDINDKVHKEFRTEEEYHGTWDFREHTVLENTDAYGRISFDRANQQAKYARVDGETGSVELFELLTTSFKLSTPGVVISVIGSLLGFTVSSKIEKIIQRGMIKAAITTNGWITTSGYDCGHVKSVGDALRTNNGGVPCIGFSSWGCLPDDVQQAFVIKPEQIKDGIYHCRYPKNEVVPGSHRENLENNHSHFILADQGCLSDWNCESNLRYRLEAYMRDTINVPVVLVVLQGGVGVARQLQLALAAGTPAVIVYGSGGVCDVIVDLIRHDDELRLRERKLQTTKNATPSDEGSVCTCSTEERLSLTCPVVMQSLTETDLSTEASRIKESITKYRDLLILFDMADSHYDGLDTALLEALVKAQATTDEATASGKQLSGVQVALGWNRPDFAEKLLNADKAAKDEKALGSLLVHSMAWNLFDFTDLLLSHGASIPMVAANVVVLYGKCRHVDHLKRFVRYRLGERGEIKLDDKKTIDNMINALTEEHNNFDSNVSNESDPFFELMVWAALSLYPELAEMMWKQTQEPIKGALFVVIILRNLLKAKKVIINSNERHTLNFMKGKFIKLALQIMDCLQENSEPALREKALVSGWERMNHMSYMDMVYACKAKDFAAHPACQELLEKRWKKGVTSEVGLFTVMLVTIFPFLVMTPFVSFRRDWVHKRKCNSLLRMFARKWKAFFISPRVKFWTEVEFYLVFLIFQTYVILFKIDKIDKRNQIDGEDVLCDHNFTPKLLLYIWFGMFLLDEILQIYNSRHFWTWFNVFWNKLDAFMYLVNLCGLILVNIPAAGDANSCFKEGPYNIGRMFLATSSILFFLRLFHMLISDKALGPTILMIKKMVDDFKVFLILFLIIAIAFGVGYTVVLTDPSDLAAENTTQLLYGMAFYPLFQMFGELYVDDLSSEKGAPNFPSNKTETFRDSGRTGFVVALVAVYMAMVVLMLVNILIAMFSDTYSKIKQREDVVFKFQRLELLMEMEDSYLPPPFSLIHFIVERITAKSKCPSNSEVYDHDNKWFDSVIRSAVIDSLEDFLKKERNAKGSGMEALMEQSTKNLKQKIYELQGHMDNIQAAMHSNFTSIDTSLADIKSLIHDG